MKSKIASAVVAMAVFAVLAVSAPARAEGLSVCDLDPNTNASSWFAHAVGMCRP
ncbi:hypothetical protein [Archangium primigenium]|uniref:hypothetical protein n=1 Tax=Melittangium TaxID=44 RepID=UPI00195DB168|nr:hypothetical protein [Archangium primigenium]MBM7113852.1 hypothetical protein [Archangium primigenium]